MNYPNNKVKSKSFISEKGKREINEDYLIYHPNKFYAVLDGVGGNGNGEIASKLVGETVKESLLKSKSITEAIEEAEKKLSSYKTKYPLTEQMATTIAVAEIIENSILVSWAGDSRVYQFRDGKIIFKTTDHTWVAEAVKKGILSSLEALFHPRANDIEKSIKDSSNPVKMEQVLIDDIQTNDCFLICTDGVIQSLIDSDLEELFYSFTSSNDIIQELKKCCETFSEDNFTAIMFKIESIS
ncbi:MAG: serine/threonine-protein phosphatase [Flavobacteriaceae bacterium]|nr:serine/threonine-protein phosphatase [Flavobacteriaceae bacterium]